MSDRDQNGQPAASRRRQRGIFEHPRRSGIWWACYFDEHGKRHREKVGPKGLARQVYARRKTEIAERRFFPERIRRREVLLGEAIDDYLTRVKGRMRSYENWERTAGVGTPRCQARRCVRSPLVTSSAMPRAAAQKASPMPA
jgi:hypothetical protein